MSAAARIEVARQGPSTPWVGQLVPIAVDVWRPWQPELATPLEPFSLDDVTAAGMIVKWSSLVSPPDERQEGETHFLVQHRLLLVFPQSDGTLALPPVVARWTDITAKKTVVAISPELKFTAAIPQGAGEVLPLVANAVSFEQTFDRDITKLRVGDGFTRLLTLRAKDTDAIVFPELAPPTVSGLTAYPAGPRTDPSTERGEIRAKETLRITYVVDRVGPHAVAGLAVRWLEPGSGRYLVAGVPDLTLWTGPNWALGFRCFGTASDAVLATELGSLVSFALLTFAIVRRARHGPGRLARNVARLSRERRAFRAAVQAAKHESGLTLLHRLYTWLVVRDPDSLERTLAPLEAATPEARKACAAFERSLFLDTKAGSAGSAFVGIVRRARSAMGRARQRAALTDLNPSSEKGGV